MGPSDEQAWQQLLNLPPEHIDAMEYHGQIDPAQAADLRSINGYDKSAQASAPSTVVQVAHDTPPGTKLGPPSDLQTGLDQAYGTATPSQQAEVQPTPPATPRPMLSFENTHGVPDQVQPTAPAATNPAASGGPSAGPSGPSASQAYLDELAHSEAQRDQADTNVANVEAQKQGALAQIYQSNAQIINSAATQAQTSAEQDRQRVQKAYQDADQADSESQQRADAISKMQVDPHHYFNNMSTPLKILTAINLVVGGIGAGLARQPSVALEAFKDASDKDIAVQQQSIENAKDRDKALREISERRFGRAMSLTELNARSRLDMLNIAQQKVMAGIQSTQDINARAAGQTVLADLQRQKQQNMDVVAAERYKINHAAELAAAARGAAAQKRAEDNHKAYIKTLNDYIKIFPAQKAADLASLTVYGHPGGELPEELKEATAAAKGGHNPTLNRQIAYDEVGTLTAQMQDLLEQPPSFENAVKYRGMQAQLTNALSRAETGYNRAPSPSEQELLKKQIPSYVTGQASKSMRDMFKHQRDIWADQQKSLGQAPTEAPGLPPPSDQPSGDAGGEE